LAGHNNVWDNAEEYYQKILKQEHWEVKQGWMEEGVNTRYSKEIAEESEESEVDEK
jgi:hypothetical protein